MTKPKLRPDQLRGQRMEYNLRHLYGITEAEYETMLADQGGRCKICGSKRPDGGRWWRFEVDHDHEAHEIRGLLCGHCNRMLGFAKNDPQILLRAAMYLLEFHKQLAERCANAE